MRRKPVCIVFRRKADQKATDQEATGKPTCKKVTGQLCGILWDVDSPLNGIMALATDYCYPQYGLSPQVE